MKLVLAFVSWGLMTIGAHPAPVSRASFEVSFTLVASCSLHGVSDHGTLQCSPTVGYVIQHPASSPSIRLEAEQQKAGAQADAPNSVSSGDTVIFNFRRSNFAIPSQSATVSRSASPLVWNCARWAFPHEKPPTEIR
jgi:hypothetical protein